MKYLLLFLLLFSLVGCAPTYITRGQLHNVKKGASVEDVMKQLKKTEAIAKAEFTYKNKKYKAHQYSLQTGSRQEMTMSCTKDGCYPIYYSVPVTEPYVFLYDGTAGKLIDWGLMEKLSKSNNSLVSGVMPTVKIELANSKKAKK